MPKDRPISRDELKGALTLILIFISVIGGRELGNFYANYQEMTKLKVLFEVKEEKLSRYIIDLVQGIPSELEVGLIITSPRINNSARIVTETPEYVNRWLVGLTVSPILVNQPEASDVEIEMLIEDNKVNEALYNLPKQKISFIRYTVRSIKLDIDDREEFERIVNDASLVYGGEIKVTFRGSVRMHLLFLETWLPFSVTRYPLLKAPHLSYVDSEWRSYTNSKVSSLSINESGYVLVTFKNPTRLHSLREDITCRIYRQDIENPVLNITKNIQIPPNTDGQYVFPFRFLESGNYTYEIVSKNLLLKGDSLILSIG
jgi:hypothetical protein